MLVIFEGIKKDLQPSVAKKLLEMGKAKLIEKEEVKKTRKKVTDE